MTGLMDEETSVIVVYLDFGKPVSTVSHSILIDTLVKCGLGKWTTPVVSQQTASLSFCVLLLFLWA